MTREEARQIIASWLVSSKGEKGQCGYIEEKDVEAFHMAIEALEQNRPTAHWKDGKWCSNCGEGIPTDVWNGGVEKDEIKFCFSCGARMESDNE